MDAFELLRLYDEDNGLPQQHAHHLGATQAKQPDAFYISTGPDGMAVSWSLFQVYPGHDGWVGVGGWVSGES